MQLSLEDKVIEVSENAVLADILHEHLSGKKFKSVVACKLDGQNFDLSAKITPNTKQISLLTADDKDGLEIIRHSTAHVLAAAVKRLFPEVQVTIGPAIENGFYYDFATPKAFSSENFEAIEKEMAKIVAEASVFERQDLSSLEAIEFFKKQNELYKLELIEDLARDHGVQTVSLYTCAGFTDLCRGVHIPNTAHVKSYKLMSVAGAYWRGDSNKAMLSRIYGVAFATEKEIKEHLNRLEEAKKRDHRKLGKELNLFSFQEDVAPGMVFWLPKGMLIRTILEDFLRKEHLKRGYELVQGPQIMRKDLWEKSGHYDNYRDNMYFTEIHDDIKNTVDVHAVKPMNCLAHMLIYNTATRSYRDLPQRYFELGVVHRHEKSGALHGLLRVRQFTQDDAHIMCAPESLEEEIIGVMKLSDDLMNLFGFSYKIVISTRPEKSIGSDEAWELATNALIHAVELKNLPYQINAGDGAFYGPKIDIKVTDAIGREWQLSTIQVDFTLPERFDLNYVASDGNKYRPVMVHRAILGSLERFIGVLTEHFAGAFPTWLSPVQVRVLSVTDKHNDYANDVCEFLQNANIRVETDCRNEKLGFKVREAQMSKIPYILVIGDKELEDKGVNVRLRSGENLGFKTLNELCELIFADLDEPFKTGGMRYKFA